MRSYYDNTDLWCQDVYESGHERARLEIVASLIPKDTSTLLDVGSGNGAFLKVVESNRPDLSCLGLERSPIAVAAKLCQSEFVLGSAESLPFANSMFDIVTCMAVIEHLPLDVYDMVLSELIRVTRRYIIIDVPYKERRVRICCPDCGCGFDPHHHLRSYWPDSFSHMLKGFQEVRRTVMRGPEPLVSWIQRRLAVELSATRFESAVCPQCGWRSSAVARGSPAPKISKIRLSQLLPKVSEEREIAILFAREPGI